MIGKWLPKFEISFLATIIYIGSHFGNVVALPLTGYMVDSGLFGGWPSAFYIIGKLFRSAYSCKWINYSFCFLFHVLVHLYDRLYWTCLVYFLDDLHS